MCHFYGHGASWLDSKGLIRCYKMIKPMFFSILFPCGKDFVKKLHYLHDRPSRTPAKSSGFGSTPGGHRIFEGHTSGMTTGRTWSSASRRFSKFKTWEKFLSVLSIRKSILMDYEYLDYLSIIRFLYIFIYYWLVFAITILKNMSSSMGRMTSHIYPYIMENNPNV